MAAAMMPYPRLNSRTPTNALSAIGKTLEMTPNTIFEAVSTPSQVIRTG